MRNVSGSNSIIENSVWASFVLSTFWASAHTDNLGTGSCAALGLSFPSLSLPSLSKNDYSVIILLKKTIILLEQSWLLADLILSFADNCCVLCFLIDLPHPAVIVPNLENALFTIGLLGTLLGRVDSISGTCKKLLLVFGRFCWGLNNVGTGLANNSATGTWGDPKPVWMP